MGGTFYSTCKSFTEIFDKNTPASVTKVVADFNDDTTNKFVDWLHCQAKSQGNWPSQEEWQLYAGGYQTKTIKKNDFQRMGYGDMLLDYMSGEREQCFNRIKIFLEKNEGFVLKPEDECAGTKVFLLNPIPNKSSWNVTLPKLDDPSSYDIEGNLVLDHLKTEFTSNKCMVEKVVKSDTLYQGVLQPLEVKVSVVWGKVTGVTTKKCDKSRDDPAFIWRRDGETVLSDNINDMNIYHEVMKRLDNEKWLEMFSISEDYFRQKESRMGRVDFLVLEDGSFKINESELPDAAVARWWPSNQEWMVRGYIQCKYMKFTSFLINSSHNYDSSGSYNGFPDIQGNQLDNRDGFFFYSNANRCHVKRIPNRAKYMHTSWKDFSSKALDYETEWSQDSMKLKI